MNMKLFLFERSSYRATKRGNVTRHPKTGGKRLKRSRPVHEPAIVMKKEVDRGSSQSMTDYCLDIRMANGSIEHLEVSRALLNNVKQYDIVHVCKRVSIFGIEYWYVHL